MLQCPFLTLHQASIALCPCLLDAIQGEVAGPRQQCAGVTLSKQICSSGWCLPAGCDNEVKLWDLGSNQQSTVGRHDGPVRSVSGCCCTSERVQKALPGAGPCVAVELLCDANCHVQPPPLPPQTEVQTVNREARSMLLCLS